jgi:hypothetical protein
VDVKFNLSWYYPEKIRTMAFIGSKGMISWDEENKTIKGDHRCLEEQLDELQLHIQRF